MPSDLRMPMDLLTRSDRSFEVLLHTLPGTRYGMEARWYQLGPFAERLDALAEYEALCRDFPPGTLVVPVLVAVVHDDATGLYRDRILEARGRAPLIRREGMLHLSTPERRRLIAAAAAPRRPRRGPLAPAAEGGRWTWLRIAAWGTATLGGLGLWAWVAAKLAG